MGRRRFEQAFELEAARPVRERRGSVARAARDLDVGENMLRQRVGDFAADPRHAVPDQGR